MIAIFVFVASLAFLVYVIAGYPVLVSALANMRPRPVNKAPLTKTVSILIAVHDGEAFIRGKLESIRALDYPPGLIETFVLCDGCTDRTEAIAREFPDVHVISLPRGGKPAALNQGLLRARNDILLFTDVRQRLAADCLRQLVANFNDPAVGVASGDLEILRGHTQEEADVGFYWRMEASIRRNLSRIDSIFGATGPIYAMRRELAVPMPPEVLLDDMYEPLAAFFQGYRLIVDPAAKAYDFPTSLDTEFRRKVRTLAGNYQLLRYYPELLGPRNRMWFLYVSQKPGRLLMPYALAAAVLSSFFLPHPWNLAAVAGGALAFAAAAVDRYIPQVFAIKRVSSLLRTFLVMMAASACAVSIFFVPPQRLWKVTTRVGSGKGVA